MELSNEELRRYARQWSLPEVGIEGQQRLREARVLCIGAGGLGSPIAIYLAAAGVGSLGIVDSDDVELSNLHRQILHATSDLGRPKAVSAQLRLKDLNPNVRLHAHHLRLTARNALELVRDYDLVVDGSDNFATRYLANDACVLVRKPNVYGAILRFEGQASVFAPHLGAPCYRCLFPEAPPPGLVPSCAEAGVLGVLPGLIGCIQATEALKWILGLGTLLTGRLLVLNALEMRFREIKVRRDPACPICGDTPSIRELTDGEASCASRSGAHSGLPVAEADEASVVELKQVLDNPNSGVRVLDVRDPDERRRASIPGTVSLPLGSLPERYSDLDPGAEYLIHCQSGLRSLKAVAFLKAHGFRRVRSVRGGLLAWAHDFDRATSPP